jgi:hypothetical protein
VLRAYCIVLVVACAACSTAATPLANFERCLADDRACDASVLTVAEQQRLFDLHREQHLQDCLSRMRCNESALSEQELREVRRAVADLNFGACMKGEASCQQPTLTDAQRAEAEEASRVRNFELCVGGLTGCDEFSLTPSQSAAARAAYLQRNFSGCMNTVGTLVRCNPQDLSKEQRELVRLRNLSANLYVCSSGIPGCDERMLTSEQRGLMKDR